MDEYTHFLLDIVTICFCLFTSINHLVVGWIRRSDKNQSYHFDVSVMGLALILLVVTTSTLKLISHGDVLPSIDLNMADWIGYFHPLLTVSHLLLEIFSFVFLTKVLEVKNHDRALVLAYYVIVSMVAIYEWCFSSSVVNVGWIPWSVWFNDWTVSLAALVLQFVVMGRAIVRRGIYRSPVMFLIVVLMEAFYVLSFTSVDLYGLYILAFAVVIPLLLMAKTNRDAATFMAQQNIISDTEISQRFSELKDLDLAIVKNLIQGMQYKEIADAHDTSMSNLKKRIHLIYKKYKVQNRTELFLLLRPSEVRHDSLSMIES